MLIILLEEGKLECIYIGVNKLQFSPFLLIKTIFRKNLSIILSQTHYSVCNQKNKKWWAQRDWNTRLPVEYFIKGVNIKIIKKPITSTYYITNSVK